MSWVVTRILLISQAPGVGGAERVVLTALAICKGLDVVVAAKPAVAEFADGLGYETIEMELPRASLGLPLIPGGIRVAAAAREVKAEVLYANQLHAIPFGITARLLGGPPLLAHNHEILHGPLARSVEAGLSLIAASVISPSLTAAPRVPKHKLHVIPNGIDTTRFSPAPIGTDHPKTGATVGTLTRPSKGKGAHEFIALARALSHRSDVNFVLGGGPLFPAEEVLFEEIKEQAVSDGVATVGLIDDPVGFYRSLDVFIHSGAPEAFGVTLIEAMSCGVPVIAFDWGGVAEIVEDGRSGLLVQGGDIKALSSGLERLIDDPLLRYSLAAQGRALVTQEFRIEDFALRLQAEIERVLRSR